MTARETMIDGAIDLFARRGVAGTSLRDVVEHSGAPRGSIYHHFPGGKDELATAAATRAGVLTGDLISKLAETDPAVAVTELVEVWCRRLERSDFEQGCPVAASALAADETPGARAAAGEAFDRWSGLLRDALLRSGVPAEEAGSRANLAVCAVEGAILVSRARRSVEPLRAAGQALARSWGTPPA